MSERDDSGAPIGVAGLEGMSAGAMLRAARERRGLHIAALAASMKVTPRKLEALEGDRYAELPDLTFTRALAQSVCRALKTDAEPVLAKLPHAGDLPKLAQVGGGLNAPFRAAPAGRDPADFNLHRKPVFWATLVVLAAALVLAFVPERWMPWRTARLIAGTVTSPVAMMPKATAPTSVGAVSIVTPVAASAAMSEPTSALQTSGATIGDSAANAAPVGTVIETVHSAPPPSQSGSAAATTAMLALRTSADSWIDVQDGRGQSLLSRNVQPGETVGLDGALPLRLTIGNAAVTQLTFRGQAVDLSASTRDNVARLQLPQR
jgi:cytoskeleton protein RodZ